MADRYLRTAAAPAFPRRHTDFVYGGQAVKHTLSVLALVFAVVVVSTCGTIQLDPSLLKKKPEAELEKIDIEAISLRDITFLFQIAIKNPFPLDLSLAGVRMRFIVEKNQLFATETKGGLNVPASGKESSKFSVNVKYVDIEKAARNYMNSEFLDCQVQGEIIVKLPTGGVAGLPGTWEFPFSFTKKIPTIKPEVRITNFKVSQPSKAEIMNGLKRVSRESLSVDKVAGLFGDIIAGKKPTVSDIVPADLDVKFGVSFTVELENKTKSKIAFKTIDYAFAVNNAKLIEGTTKNIVTTGTKSSLNINNQFSSKALGDAVVKAFMDKTATFSIKGKTFIQLPATIKKEPVKLDFEESGTMKI